MLTNAIRDYAWGSTTHLAEFQERAPSGEPEAELWIGAHDGDPSTLSDGRKLDAVIADDPLAMLGEEVCGVFGQRLPFLMKVLAVEEPLSLQVHPSSDRARTGHADENHEGVPLDSPQRSYKDPWHKPELLYALTHFEGMAGFRDVESSADLLRLLHLPWADDVADRLDAGPAVETLRSVVTESLALEGRTLERLLRDLAEAALDAEPTNNGEAARVCAHTVDLVTTYPCDPGVLVALLLNHIVLAPGEAMFVNAGVVHTYISGVGLEIMASSDNVLRAGLTPKHVDVEELLSVTNFTPIPPPRWDPAEHADDCVHLAPPVAEFGLTVGRTPLRCPPPSGPRILLALEGEVTVVTQDEQVHLSRGQSVYIRHDDGPFEVSGDGNVAVGAVPD